MHYRLTGKQVNIWVSGATGLVRQELPSTGKEIAESAGLVGSSDSIICGRKIWQRGVTRRRGL